MHKLYPVKVAAANSTGSSTGLKNGVEGTIRATARRMGSGAWERMVVAGSVLSFSKPLRRLPTPSLADVFFVALLLAAFLRPGGLQSLLADGDIGWHVRTGQAVLASGSAPRVRPLFVFAPRPAVVRLGMAGRRDLRARLGVARDGRRRGAGGGRAVPVGRRAPALAAAPRGRAVDRLGNHAGRVQRLERHYLARPHVFSILAYHALLWALDEDRRRPRLWIWLLVPGAALWANLHGGFVALPATLALAATVSALERRWTRARRYGLLASLCLAATCWNPYGWRLHRHILEYLRSSWILDHVQEFQSPAIRSEGMVVFALLLLGGIAMASRGWLGRVVRRRAGIGLGLRGAAIRAPHPVLRHCGRAGHRFRVRSLVARGRGACAAAFGSASFLGLGAGPGPSAAYRPLAGGRRRAGAGHGRASRAIFPTLVFRRWRWKATGLCSRLPVRSRGF